jgi:hypothetical protein
MFYPGPSTANIDTKGDCGWFMREAKNLSLTHEQAKLILVDTTVRWYRFPAERLLTGANIPSGVISYKQEPVKRLFFVFS